MIVVIDTNYIIKQLVPVEKISVGYITSSVQREIKDKTTMEYFQFANLNIIIKDPKDEYVNRVKNAIQNKHFGMSDADIDVVALTLEISDELSSSWIDQTNITNLENVVCLTDDNGVKSALLIFGLCSDESFSIKTFKLRCYACYTIYDKHVDFCKNCGYSTITRVSVSEKNGETKVYLKSDYKPKNKILRGPKGMVFECADQKEYIKYCEDQQRMQKKEEIDSENDFFY